MPEQFANDAVSTLDGDIDATQTTLAVSSSSRFSSAGNFRLRIGEEIMLCTGRVGTTMTVVRGVEGTTPAAHTDDTEIRQALTAGGLTQAISEANPGAAGLVVPHVADFAQVNPTYISAADKAGRIEARFTRDPSNRRGGLFLKNRPGPTYQMDIGLKMHWLGQELCGVLPLVFRNSSGGAYHCLFQGFDGNNFMFHYDFNGDDTYNGGGLVDPVIRVTFGVLHFFRVVSDGTYRTYFYSLDNVTWHPFYRESNTAGVTEDQVGFGGYAAGQSNPVWATGGLVHSAVEVVHFTLT